LVEFEAQLGAPVNGVDTHVLEQVARDWGVVLPTDVLEVLSAYGDSIISDQIVLHGPRTLSAAGACFGSRLSKGLDDEDGPEALPRPGGLLLWATTPDGDEFCLRDQGDGKWTVSIYDGENLQWTHTEDEFSDWLLGGLVGKPRYRVLPPWPARRPHRVVPLDPVAFERVKEGEDLGGPRRFVCPVCRAAADLASIFAHWCPECESTVNFVADVS
jgi:hypothetical protein